MSSKNSKHPGSVAQATTSASTKPTPKPPGKTDTLIRLLSAKHPPSLTLLCDRLGWQPHSTRAAICRLRKAGHKIETVSSSTGGAVRYRLPPAQKAVNPDTGTS